MRRLLAAVGLIALAACSSWEHDVQRGGFSFSKYRVDSASGGHRGVLAEDAAIDGFICQSGGWAHFSRDWTLQACFLAEPYMMEHMTIPAGTWAMPKDLGLLAAFAQDTPCQRFICGGTGGPKGTQASFYSDGKLRSFFPPDDVKVGTVLCKATPFASVDLHRNGALKQCIAASRIEIDGVRFARGKTVSFSETGKPN